MEHRALHPNIIGSSPIIVGLMFFMPKMLPPLFQMEEYLNILRRPGSCRLCHPGARFGLVASAISLMYSCNGSNHKMNRKGVRIKNQLSLEIQLEMI